MNAGAPVDLHVELCLSPSPSSPSCMCRVHSGVVQLQAMWKDAGGRVTASRRAPAAPPSALSKRPLEARVHSSASRSPVQRSLICSPALCADAAYAPSSALGVRLQVHRCRYAGAGAGAARRVQRGGVCRYASRGGGPPAGAVCGRAARRSHVVSCGT